jgi:hypothetical protein
MTTKADNHAAAHYLPIVRMLARMSCNQSRLLELWDEREELTASVNGAETPDALNEAREALTIWETANAEELAKLACAAGAYLAGANLAGANLAGANLAGANLAGADLSRAKSCNP